MATEHKLFVLGPPRFEADNSSLEIKPRKALALFVFLAVSQQPFTRDALATLFWPDADQPTARASLRRTLYRLSRTIPEGLIEINGDMIQTAPESSLWIDLVEYNRYLEPYRPGFRLSATRSGAGEVPADILPRTLEPQSVEQLEKAAQLVQDDFLAGFSLPDAPEFDEWQFFQTEELRQTQVQVLDCLVSHYIAQGELVRALGHARRRLAMDPLHEPVHRMLMQLYAWSDQHSAAIRQYQECVRILATELDAPPDEATLALYETIRAKRLPTPAPAPPAASSPSAPPPVSYSETESPQGRASPPLIVGSLEPTSILTPFVGRARELEAISQLMIGESLCRLLTIVGPGGCGKTRIARQLADHIVESPQGQQQFPDGIFLVNLAAIDSADRFSGAVAQTLELMDYNKGSTLEQVEAWLSTKRAILILDNFEHILDATAQLAELLAAAPRIKILVTSRVGLALQEAWHYPIAGLSFPSLDTNPTDVLEKFEAIQLFVHAARRARIDFRLEGQEEYVLQICHIVEGAPLALELAASWLKVLSPAQIVEEISNNLDILTSRYQNVSTRHRSMRAVLEQTWNLLTHLEQDVLMKLALFRGGFRTAAAQAVAGASISTLAILAEKSLIRLDEEGRYQIHELLRQFAHEILESSPDVALETYRRHSDYYFAFLRQRNALLTSPQQPHVLREVAEELENIEIAWHSMLKNSPEELIGQEINSYWRIYWIRGRAREGLAIFSSALQQLERLNSQEKGPRTRIYRHLLQQRARYRFFLGYLDEALADFETCVTLAEELDLPVAKADTQVDIGSIYVWKGVRDAAMHHLTEALKLFRAHNLHHGEAGALQELGRLYLAFGDYAAGQRCATQTLQISRRLERPDWIGYGLITLAWCTYCQGDYATARHAFYDAQDIFTDIGHQLGISGCLGGLAWVSWAESLHSTANKDQMLDDASALAHESLIILRRIGHRLQMSHRLYCLAQIHLERGDFEQVEKYATEGMQLGDQIGAASFYTGNIFCLGQAAWNQEDWYTGREYLRQGLRVAHQCDLRPLMVNGLIRYGLLRQAEARARYSDLNEIRAAQQTAIQAFRLSTQHIDCWYACRERAKVFLQDAERDGAELIESPTPLTLEQAIVRALGELQKDPAGRSLVGT